MPCKHLQNNGLSPSLTLQGLCLCVKAMERSPGRRWGENDFPLFQSRFFCLGGLGRSYSPEWLTQESKSTGGSKHSSSGERGASRARIGPGVWCSLCGLGRARLKECWEVWAWARKSPRRGKGSRSKNSSSISRWTVSTSFWEVCAAGGAAHATAPAVGRDRAGGSGAATCARWAQGCRTGARWASCRSAERTGPGAGHGCRRPQLPHPIEGASVGGHGGWIPSAARCAALPPVAQRVPSPASRSCTAASSRGNDVPFLFQRVQFLDSEEDRPVH